MRVVKVGGSVLRAASDYARHAKLALELGARVIVVSAMRGVTDALLHAAETRDERMLHETLDSIVSVAEEVGAKGFEKWVDRCTRAFKAYSNHPSRQLLDEILATGERVSAYTMAAALEGLASRVIALDGGEAGIVTDDRFGEARPLVEDCFAGIRRALEPLLPKYDAVVVAGFVGSTRDGRTTTMGRGASDLTASLVAAALNASELYLVTDTPCLMSADPDLVPTAHPLKQVGLSEADAMAELGVKRFHPLTFKILRGSACRVVVGSSPPAGTEIEDTLPPPDLKVVSLREGKLVFVGRGAKRLAPAVARDLGLRLLEVGGLYFTLTPGDPLLLLEAHKELLKYWCE
ncbi:MAG: hypothetical protein QXI84_06115 [Thermofilaceae archaeon]